MAAGIGEGIPEDVMSDESPKQREPSEDHAEEAEVPEV